MTVYGDLDVSVIDELPPAVNRYKHPPVRSCRAPYQFIRKKLKAGDRLTSYPLIEESEKLDLKNLEEWDSTSRKHSRIYRLQDARANETGGKEEVMRRFVANEAHIVLLRDRGGVNVPTRSDGDRCFSDLGSLLHQLRGRVGGEPISLFADYALRDIGRYPQADGDHDRENDGFVIAEADLARGPGDEGTQQSGLFDLRIADLVR